AWSTIGSIPAACCSGQLKTQDPINPPSAVRRSPVSVSCPVSSSKLLFISVRTWRATGASSCTAFSKWASLSLRLAEPPCVPSRRSSKWRIKLVIYVGTALSAIAYLLLRIAMLLERLRIRVNRLLPLLIRESPSRHRHLLAVLPRSLLKRPHQLGRSPSPQLHLQWQTA